MFPSASFRRSAVRPALAVCAVLMSGRVMAAPVLTSAEASVRFTSPLSCEVVVRAAIDGATEVEHRLEVLDGASVELVGLEQAAEARPARDIGRTRALVLRPASAGTAYAIRYRVQQAPSRPGRCPIWLPTAPTDGRSRSVRVSVDLPDGQAPAANVPAFAWQGTRGTAILPHLPAFVIVPFGPAGQSRAWDISRVMDGAAVASIALASVLWARRRRTAH